MKTASSAGKGLLLLLLWAWVQLACAEGAAAVVVSLTGTVSAQKPGGKIRALAKDSALMPGEIVLTEKGSSARLRFADDSTVALRPGSRLVIENFNYDIAKPESDSLVLNLVKGGMRAVSGAVGKRGNQAAYSAQTSAGTIGIRGTDYALLMCEKRGKDQESNCSELDVPEDRRSDGAPVEGMYLTVFEGAIAVANDSTETVFRQGKSGYVKDKNTAPLELPKEPGLAREFPSVGNLPGAPTPFGGAAGACLVR